MPSAFVTIPLLQNKKRLRVKFLNDLSTPSFPFLHIQLPPFFPILPFLTFDSNEHSNEIRGRTKKIKTGTHSSRWTVNKTAPGNTRSSLPTLHRLPNAIRLGILWRGQRRHNLRTHVRTMRRDVDVQEDIHAMSYERTVLTDPDRRGAGMWTKQDGEGWTNGRLGPDRTNQLIGRTETSKRGTTYHMRSYNMKLACKGTKYQRVIYFIDFIDYMLSCDPINVLFI